MRRPSSSSFHSPLRRYWQASGDDVRETSLHRTITIRARNRTSDQLSRLRRSRAYHLALLERRRTERLNNETELKLRLNEKQISCTVADTDGGSFQSTTGVNNVCTDDDNVYCSHKRNNVNILFRHTHSATPFELSRIIVKTPYAGYSSPVREGLVYVSMSSIPFSETERYDRPEEDDDDFFDFLRINCHTRPEEFRKNRDSNGNSETRHGEIPVIPSWDKEFTGKRMETEPVARFQIERGQQLAEIKFDPPITGRFILMKLFNNTTEEQREKELCKEEHKEEDPLNSWFPVARDATISSTTLPPLRPPTRIPPIDDMAGDPLRFDALEDEIPDNHDSSTSSQDDPEHENVDVQAILFYGYTGRRIFPSVKAL